MGTRLTLRLLGPPEVRLGGELVVDFASNKVRALLFYLAVESGRRHRLESLAGLLWPDDPQRSARANLSTALSNLRTALSERGGARSLLDVLREVTPSNDHGDGWADVAVSDLPAWRSGPVRGGETC